MRCVPFRQGRRLYQRRFGSTPGVRRPPKGGSGEGQTYLFVHINLGKNRSASLYSIQGVFRTDIFVTHGFVFMRRPRIGAFPIITAAAFTLFVFACHKRDRLERTASNGPNSDSVKAMTASSDTVITRTEMRGMAMRIMEGV